MPLSPTNIFLNLVKWSAPTDTLLLPQLATLAGLTASCVQPLSAVHSSPDRLSSSARGGKPAGGFQLHCSILSVDRSSAYSSLCTGQDEEEPRFPVEVFNKAFFTKTVISACISTATQITRYATTIAPAGCAAVCLSRPRLANEAALTGCLCIVGFLRNWQGCTSQRVWPGSSSKVRQRGRCNLAYACQLLSAGRHSWPYSHALACPPRCISCTCGHDAQKPLGSGASDAARSAGRKAGEYSFIDRAYRIALTACRANLLTGLADLIVSVSADTIRCMRFSVPIVFHELLLAAGSALKHVHECTVI